MFTGLIEETGAIRTVQRCGQSARFVIEAKVVLNDLSVDDSIAVDGVCLTVTGVAAPTFSVEAVDETLRKTTLGSYRAGTVVNLERCLLPTDRLGGHIVQGHVDGVGLVKSWREQDAGKLLTVGIPVEKCKYVISEGSIALNGVSLTVARIAGNEVSIALIPHTLSKTGLGKLIPGSRVNIEVDLIGKYVERLLDAGSDERTAEARLRKFAQKID